ncbi:MAG TPA: LecA/PA-IL family lectin [Pyrinomonadaceae bacterium]|jgi:hypothetical protein
MRKLILAFLLMIMAASLVAADTVFLRDGRRVQGTVLGFMNGRFVVRVNEAVTAQGSTSPAIASGDIVFFRPNEIERIEIEGRSLDDARFETRTVDVALGPNWIDSGVDLRRGQRVQISATGTINAGRTRITPDGLPRSTDPNAPLPRAAEGVLIGAVGNDPNSPILELGLSREFVADRDGRLYLTANRSTYTDARGSFTVQVRTERELRAAGDDRDDNTDLFGRSRRDNPAPVRRRSRGDAGGLGDRPISSGVRTQREKSVSVPANLRNGVDTGVDLRTGDPVTINASGNITAGRRAGVVSPEGGRVGAASIIGTYPVPSAGVGALIGYIRLSNGQVTQAFFVGSQLTFNAPGDGRLFLLVNDDNYNDNSGSFDVRISYVE